MDLNNLINYIERISIIVNTEEKKFLNPLGLQTIHLEVLNYLSISNKYSNTPVAVSNYLGNTKGTTSQTINLLESKGYLKKVKNAKDKRSIKLELTRRGKSLVDLFNSKMNKISVDNKDIKVAEAVLKNILKSIQNANSNKSFGICKTCRFFIHESEGFKCGLTKEVLYTDEIDKICFEHEYRY